MYKVYFKIGKEIINDLNPVDLDYLPKTGESILIFDDGSDKDIEYEVSKIMHSFSSLISNKDQLVVNGTVLMLKIIE